MTAERSGPWLTAREAARYLSVHLNTLYRYLQQGLPAYRMGGRIRIHIRDLDNWIRSNDYSEEKETGDENSD